MPDRLVALERIEAELWKQLEQCVHEPQHAWRTPVLATLDGETPDARTVVLREVDVRQRQLLIFTDERAGKVAQLLRQPHGMLVMWSKALGWQLRCRVRLSLEMSGLAATSRWARIKLTPAAQDYLARLPPGAPLDTPEAPPQDSLRREYFAVINAQVVGIDWLELHPKGHRRAVFDAQGARWVQP